jgi:hypothetical protein
VNDETVESLLNKIVAVQEEQNTILLSHRQNFEHLHKEAGLIKRRLENLENDNSGQCADANFVAEITARVKAISAIIEANRRAYSISLKKFG